ncbi:MAG: amino acid adenylation domain-containing protein [bacterium]|nr:amino acid adenylation domain-containing protein [bacterium]
MNTAEFLLYLHSLDARLSIEDGKLRCHVPQSVATSTLRAELAARKAEIIAFLDGTESTTGSVAPALLPVARDSEIPLSLAQWRLWYLDQLVPGNSLYNCPAAVRLRGLLDVGVLARTFDEIVRRHEVLRTTFAMVDELPVQVIAPSLTVRMPIVDLHNLPEVKMQREVRQLAREEARRPFDLAQGPLLRVTVLRLGKEEHALLLTMHHIVSDGWSIGVLVGEAAMLYEAFSNEQPSPLPELPIQYADFAVWQREWLQGEVMEKQILYWKRQLGGDLLALELPADQSWSAVQTTRGRHQTLSLSLSLTSALKALGQKEGSTLFMTLLAAFKILLYRYTEQEDIIVGTPIAGRDRHEIEGLIGFFLNTLALRTDLSGSPSFWDLLRRVRKVTLDAYAHQDLPFEKIVEELQLLRDLNRHPIFDVLFNFVNTPPVALESQGMHFDSLELPEAESKFAMTLYATERDGAISLRLVYRRDLFCDERMIALLDQFQYLLEQIVAAPDRSICTYSLVTPVSRTVLPDPRITLPEPLYELITSVFASWAERLPQKTAVCQEERSWTYGELANRSQTIARLLRAQGLQRGDVVAVAGSRSFGLIAGMLGVFFSGGVLLTVDPRLPGKRQQLMLSEAQARYLLYVFPDRPRDTWVSEVEMLSVIHTDPDSGYVIDAQVPDPEMTRLPSLSCEDAAYIFFTSGTSGVPKGVLGNHKGLAHFLDWQRSTFSIGPHDRCAQLTALSFDVVLRDIFTPLTSGATLCLPEGDDYDPKYIMPWLERERVSILHTVPALAQTWLTNVPPEVSLRHLQWIFLAGEPLKDTLVHRWRAAFPDAGEIVNLYGPTETTLAKCFYRVPADPLPGVQPLGTALPETQALVLAKGQRLCGISELGEIVIRTPFRSLGYVNASRAEQKRFVKTPFRDDEGDVLYYTGDRGRYRPDGVLEILGRLDDQVKIRGARVELGEIESVLAQHSAVRDSVVVALPAVGNGDQSADEKHMVAYIVQDGELGDRDLRRHLMERLPLYMLPSVFVTLEALPLTPNGKVDRRALLAFDGVRPELEGGFVAPRTPTEEVLVGIWAYVLGVEQVGIHDNFFQLGGHSLLATRVISRIRQTFQVELPLHALFEASTVTDLAERVEVARRAGQGLLAPPLRPVVPRDGELALSFAQQRLWFLDQLEPGNPFYNIPSAVRLTGPLDVVVLEQSLNEIVRRHEALRTTFVTLEGRPLQIIAPVLTMVLPVVDLRKLPEAQREVEVQRLASEEAQWSFDLARGPLVRATVLQLGEACPLGLSLGTKPERRPEVTLELVEGPVEGQGQREEHVLLVTMHHIVSDAWSMGTFIREMVALYQAFLTGESALFPGLPVQYADFAVWQREWLQGEVLETQFSYWKERLSDAPTVLELPTDRPRPPVQTYQGATESFGLSEDLTAALQELSRQEGSTLFMTLLAAFNTLLYRYTRQENILVGSPIANRNRAEIEDLIGLFVNMLVLQTDLSGNPTFWELLGQVREVALGAYAHQDLPFEVLVDALQPERDLSRSPLFQVMFVLQNAPVEALELPNLTVSRLEADSKTAKFDLTLTMAETAQGLRGALEYNTDLFDAGTIDRLVGHFQVLLQGIVADPDQRIADVPILTDAERQLLLVEWNDTWAEYPKHRCIHELFEAQVERTPDAVAVVFEERHLTYRELNRRANQLAHHLQGLGVGPEVLVGICVERSLEMVVGLLGILKAGGAYVPLDSAYPEERLAFMLEGY